VSRAWRFLVDQWLEWPRVDYLLSLPGLLILLIPGVGKTASDLTLAVATVAGVLLGMTGVIITIYQAGEGPRMRALRSLAGGTTRRNWIAILAGDIIVCFGSLLALASSDAAPTLAVGGCGYAVGLLTWRTTRMVWIVHSYLALADLDSLDKSGGLTVRDDLQQR